jgi:hypothetical protein
VRTNNISGPDVSCWHRHLWLVSAACYACAAAVPTAAAAAAAVVAGAWLLLLVRQEGEVLPLQDLQQLHCCLVVSDKAGHSSSYGFVHLICHGCYKRQRQSLLRRWAQQGIRLQTCSQPLRSGRKAIALQ